MRFPCGYSRGPWHDHVDMAMKASRITQPSLDEVVYRFLREAILLPDGLAGGDRIDEQELAKRLGVSRTPIREAIRRLEVEGLVKRAPRRGVFVVDFSPAVIDDLFSVREVLEGLAARLAATRAMDAEINQLQEIYARYVDAVRTHNTDAILEEDVQFHDLIASASRNERLQVTIRMFRDQLRLLRIRSVAVAGRSEKSRQEMGRILGALVRRAPAEAEEAMRHHIRGAQEDVLKALSAEIRVT